MFRLSRNKAAKSGDRLDFQFSNFKVLQVPKGWDKLFVSIVSVETGKTITKSSKALVRNGSCEWTDTLSESILVPQNESSKELDDCLFKFVVAMGSARSGILGETTINITGYMSSDGSVPVSLPLKKSSSGTILQVEIHCLAPRTKLRDGESRETNSHVEELKADSQATDVKSDVSDGVSAQSARSSSSKETGSASHPGEPESRETSFSASGSHDSYDSAEGFLSRENFSPTANIRANGHNLRQDSSSSHGNYPTDDTFQSHQSSFNSQLSGSGNHFLNNRQDQPTSPLRLSSSNKNLLEAAEDAIQELRAEAKMWERNARKLMLDLDMLKEEFSNQSKNQANLEMNLSATRAECDGLRKEVERLTLLSEKSAAVEYSAFQLEDASNFQKEMENEIKFLRESNANLALQLKRSQESNIEFVSLLQELEHEKLVVQSKSNDMENSIREKIEENDTLTTQLQQVQDSEKSLQNKVQMLEQALEDKNHTIQNGGICNHKTLSDIEAEYTNKLSTKEDEIFRLEAKLSESLKQPESSDRGNADMIREMEALQDKVQELERDCNELTDENLELLFKLKEVNNNSNWVCSSCMESLNGFEAEVGKQKSWGHHQEDNKNMKVLGEIEEGCDLYVQELERLKMELELKVAELRAELNDKRSEIEKLKANFLSKEEAITTLRQTQSELQSHVAGLEKEKLHLEENMKAVVRESDITSKCLNDLQNDLAALSSSVGTHVSANKMLERKSSELESGKCELQLRLLELEEENVQLSGFVSSLEAELRQLTDDNESRRLEREHFKSLYENLQDEITRLRNETETQQVVLKQELQDTHSRWSEVEEECEYLRRANPELHEIAEKLIEECSSFRKMNGELREQNQELKENCTLLEAKLRESSERFSECCEKVVILEENISSVLEDIASKEKSMTSELDALLEENRNLKEKLVLEENLLNEMYLEKAVEVENLQQDVQHLTMRISACYEEKDRTIGDALHEVACLREDKGKLESSLQDVQSKLKWTESELNAVLRETDEKIEGLRVELSVSKQNQAMLMADHEKVTTLLESYRSSEEKFKTAVNSLELKLTVSEYERQQLLEETSNVKVQLQKMSLLQDEVFALKNELAATKFDKEKLEGSLHLISRECEELKAEKILLAEKMSTLQAARTELEECKRSRVALEEQLQQVESDLLEKEALCVREADLRNELNRISRTNSQFQRKIQQLEKEKDECLTKSRTLEEELKLMKEEKQNQRESGSTKVHSVSKTNAKVSPIREDTKFAKNEMAKNTNHHRDNRRKASSRNDQPQELVKDRQKAYNIQHHKEGGNGSGIHDQHPQAVDTDSFSKILSLENELARAMEANMTYKAQLNRLMSESRSNNGDSTEIVTKERFERTKSSLETELKDIRERYLNMSLQYAEVEAEREELVMKLKEAKNGKRWFS